MDLKDSPGIVIKRRAAQEAPTSPVATAASAEESTLGEGSLTGRAVTLSGRLDECTVALASLVVAAEQPLQPQTNRTTIPRHSLLVLLHGVLPSIESRENSERLSLSYCGHERERRTDGRGREGEAREGVSV
jgi:hypothetical protein